MAAYTANGSQGGLEILDGLRDIRSNVQNTIPSFSIKGFSSADPISIINLPEQTTGYVLSYTDGSLVDVNYSTEAAVGAAASFSADVPSVAAATDGSRFAGAIEQEGALIVTYNGASIPLNLPNVDKVVVNRGNTVILAMVRNSDQLYRVIKLPASNNPASTLPAGYIDCEPLLLPVYCVVPVGNPTPSTQPVVTPIADRPVDAYFSLDGASAYILNCGPECGGTAAGVTVLQEGALVVTNFVTPYTAGATSPLQTLPTGVANPVLVPGGVTAALADGTNLYVSGQQLQPSGLFAGNLSTINLTSYTVTGQFSISDGNHSKMLFGDDYTLWVGSQQCASGTRAALAATQTAAGTATTQAANYNCLTRTTINSITGFSISGNTVTFTAGNELSAGQVVTASGLGVGTYLNGQPLTVLAAGLSTTQFSATFAHANVAAVNDTGTAILTPQIVPAVTQGGATPVTVPYLNTNLDPYYYGNLTGLCWVQNYHKMYTAYGGQIHAFNTIDGSEINNFLITVQGTVLDVAYMDAETNAAN
jgi:hypothetical protein